MTMKKETDKKVKLFLDSGAFSAWSKNVTIDLNAYMQFIQDNEQYIEVYSNLDVIGSAEGSWKNQEIMEANGFHPLPVFHLNDDVSSLYRCMEYPYFCLGGMAGRDCSENDRVQFLDSCWDIICDNKDRIPKQKVHGFGMTSLKLMLRYPWYSTDSTSWVMTSRFGSVYVPNIRDGKYVYNEDSWKVCVSQRSPSVTEVGQHFETFSAMEKKQILKYFDSKGFKLGKSEFRKEDPKYTPKDNERWFGKEEADSQRNVRGDRNGYVNQGWTKERTIEKVIEPGLSNDYKQRDEMNIIYFMDLEKSMPEWPWPWLSPKPKGFGMRRLK